MDVDEDDSGSSSDEDEEDESDDDNAGNLNAKGAVKRKASENHQLPSKKAKVDEKPEGMRVDVCVSFIVSVASYYLVYSESYA